MASKQKIVSTLALSAATAAMLTLSGCGGSSSSSTTPPPPAASLGNCDASVVDVLLTGDIAAQTLDATKVYGIDGRVRLLSGELIAPAGTTFAGCTPSSYLMIKPGAKLTAIGTQAKPITFTSQVDLLGQSAANEVGEWGGLILLGNAFTDHGVVGYEAGQAEDTFGATDHTHDTESSGTLDYVLVKHTGFKVAADKELNGLSMGGVGSGTTITNIAVVGGADDAMEIWGGTVNVTGYYAYNAKDDSVDTDLGYRGTITNVYVKQNIVDKTNNHDSAAIETGNDDATFNSTYPTLATIVNFTADVTGAGIYMKNDAGLALNNAQFTSAKTVDTQLATYRTQDVVDTGTMNIVSTCMKNASAGQAGDDYLAIENTKDTGTGKTASTDLSGGLGVAVKINDTSCTGVNVANIWKGKVGSNDPLEN